MLAAEQTYSQEVLLLGKQLVVCQCPQCISAVSATPVTWENTRTPACTHAHTKTSASLHLRPSLDFVVALLSCCWHTRKHTHSQMITRCWHPHSAPLPLHQLLLPQQQVSSRPPPPAFCQRWTTGAFQPWTQTKQTHTCWVIRSVVAMVAEFLKLHVDVFTCLPVCWHSHKLHWIVLQNEKMWLLLERILSELRFRSLV